MLVRCFLISLVIFISTEKESIVDGYVINKPLEHQTVKCTRRHALSAYISDLLTGALEQGDKTTTPKQPTRKNKTLCKVLLRATNYLADSCTWLSLVSRTESCIIAVCWPDIRHVSQILFRLILHIWFSLPVKQHCAHRHLRTLIIFNAGWSVILNLTAYGQWMYEPYP